MCFQQRRLGFIQSLKEPRGKLASLSWERILALPEEAGLGTEQEVLEGWRPLMARPCQGACRVRGVGYELESILKSPH